jgi:hypothetical protein
MEVLMTATHRQPRGRSLRGLLWIVLGALAASFSTIPAAEARPRPQTTSFSANKTFGVGIMLGAPTALAGKYYLGADTAVDFGLGVIQGFGRDALHLHGDFLWHPAVLLTAEPFVLPIYIGVGARIADFDDDIDDQGNNDEGGLTVGARVPLGIMMDFNNVPLDVFLEFAPVFDLIGYDAPDFDINIALGVRYYFF